MALISLQEINLAFSGLVIFDGLSAQLESGERIALLGRNGAGKTTLMKVLAGLEQVDSGKVVVQKGIKIAYLPQEVPADISGTVFNLVLSGLGKRAEIVSQYHELICRLQTGQTPELLKQIDVLQDKLNHSNSWYLNHHIEEVITKMKLEADSDFAILSGGQKRRALLARALVLKPELLLLDEPTNHLDIDSMQWLEEFLLTYTGTVLFITHDRRFMEGLATRILELDRGKLFNWPCDYKTFLERKQAALDIEETRWNQFDKKLAEEEAWIRKGVKARRCRNEGRVKALERLREEKKNQRKLTGQLRISSQKTEASGRMVIKISHLAFGYKEKCLVRDFSSQIMRGDKIGVIGPNGSGKTTLLSLLLGKITPQKGSVELGTNLQIAYYDQLRGQLDEDKTVAENVNGKSDTVIINGKPRHIMGYLQDFLFTPDRARTPVKVLSGGERNRIFLARLFSTPANVLVMDEPTNDLDIETLELLEEMLFEYPGTLLLVSHDRVFLNNVVTSTMVLEGDGLVKEYPGGYDDWLSQRKTGRPAPVKTLPAKEIVQPKKPADPGKLTFKEERELEALPLTIEKMEAEIKEMYARFSDINHYQKNPARIEEDKTRSEVLSKEIEKAYEKWAYLEDKRNKTKT